MISVPNHRQRSNGSKTQRLTGLILLVFLTVTFQSCGFIEDLFKGKEKKPRTEQPEKEKEVVIREVEWEDVTDEEGVIRNYPDETDDDEDIYDVLCLLPFYGPNQDKGRTLYAGFIMAAESIQPDINLRVTTLDISRMEREPEALRKILDTPGFDVIVTPYSTDNLNNVIELAKGSGSLLLSPWNTSPSVNRYDRYIQLNPGLQSHFSSMVDWATREYGASSTLIVSHRKDASSVEILQSENPSIENYYTDLNPKQDIPHLRKLITSKNVKALIIPSWRSSDQPYFLSLLSAINAARGMQQLSVFVLSSWMDNDDINYDQYSGLDLHFTNSRFINSSSRKFIQFEDEFIREYNYFASDELYYGHDIFRMISEWLTEYDRRIAKEIVNFECRDCFFRYDFVEEVSERGQSYILNDHVDIISFSDFRYHRVN